MSDCDSGARTRAREALYTSFLLCALLNIVHAETYFRIGANVLCRKLRRYLPASDVFVCLRVSLSVCLDYFFFLH
jgi:hypothetical protein